MKCCAQAAQISPHPSSSKLPGSPHYAARAPFNMSSAILLKNRLRGYRTAFKCTVFTLTRQLCASINCLGEWVIQSVGGNFARDSQAAGAAVFQDVSKARIVLFNLNLDIG